MFKFQFNSLFYVKNNNMFLAAYVHKHLQWDETLIPYITTYLSLKSSVCTFFELASLSNTEIVYIFMKTIGFYGVHNKR